MGSSIFALSIHADYRCRNSGVCCGADWDVPMEVPVYRSLQEAMAQGRLQVAPASAGLHPFVTGPDLPDDAAAMFERNDHGECVFFERTSRLCIVHRDLGEPALAATCRHFPRVAVRDRRGTFVSLSHFCPTASSLLFRDDVPLSIVASPVAFPPADYEGLRVTQDDLPPLLQPDVLMDLEGYTAWEHHMVGRCTNVEASPESVLATLARDARVLRTWRPGAVSLAQAVAALPRDVVPASAPDTIESSLEAFRGVITAVPDEFRPEPDEGGLDFAYREWVRPAWASFAGPLRHYIAAKAFANWTAYQGRGVASIVRGLEAAVSLVRVEAARECREAGRLLDAALMLEAFRSADFSLNHLAAGEDLAQGWSVAERE